MVKITLRNGVVVEVENLDDASKLIHKVYWKEFNGVVKETVVVAGKETGQVKGFCKVCSKPIVRGRYLQKLCGSDECKREYNRLQANKYYHRNKNKLRNKIPVQETIERIPLQEGEIKII